MPAYHLIIKGKVQGVFYRQSAKEKARQLQLNGWIKNNQDGSVESFICGDKQALQDFIDWCRKGPSGAHVTDVIIEERVEELLDNFTILRS